MSEKKCHLCGASLSAEEEQRIDGKPVCDDCYYEQMGKEIDCNPIINPDLVLERQQHKD